MKIKYLLLSLCCLCFISCGQTNAYNSEEVIQAENNLLPCPWCGSEDVEFCKGVYSNQPQIGCNNCYAVSPCLSSSTWTLDEAVEKWNSIERK